MTTGTEPPNGLPISRAALIEWNDVRAHLDAKIATIFSPLAASAAWAGWAGAAYRLTSHRAYPFETVFALLIV
jgi:hypothetical protein